MRRLGIIFWLAVGLLFLLGPEASAAGLAGQGDENQSEADAGSSTTLEAEEPAGDTPEPDSLDIDSVWAGTVALIGVVLIIRMMRTAREHEISANDHSPRAVSSDE